MKKNRFILTSVAVFVVFAAADFLVHGVCLRDLYQKTASLWRPLDEMNRLMWMMWAAYAVMAPLFVWIYSKGVESGKSGLGQGLRFGIMIGLLFSIPMALCSYVVMPIPFALAIGWFLGGLVEFVLAGVIAGLLYKTS